MRSRGFNPLPWNDRILYSPGYGDSSGSTAEKPLPPGYRRILTTQEIGDFQKFDPEKMVNNEIRNGENGMLAKIPKTPGRIARKETDDGTFIQFIHDRVYDPEKKQIRIRKTIIGQSVEAFLRGMMLINDRYYSFFDRDGNLIYKPTRNLPEQETDDPETLALEEVEYESADDREAGGAAGEKNSEAAGTVGAEPADDREADGLAVGGKSDADAGEKDSEAAGEKDAKQKTETEKEETIMPGPEQKPAQPTPPPEEKDPIWHFDATKLKTNEILFEDTVLAKIPEIPGRINRRKRPETDVTYIEMVLERHYDPVSRQTRKKRISIGTDAAPAFPGMMLPNEAYYRYFDHDGDWIGPEAETDPEMKNILEKWKAARKARQKATGAPERSGEEGTMRSEEAEEYRSQNTEGPEENEDAEDQAMRQEAARKARAKAHLKYLQMLFLDYHGIVSIQAKKKPQLLMTVYQVVQINELLTELKRFFEGTDMYPYLKVVEIPKEIDGDLAPVTYGDMAILLKPYYRAMNALMYGTA